MSNKEEGTDLVPLCLHIISEAEICKKMAINISRSNYALYHRILNHCNGTIAHVNALPEMVEYRKELEANGEDTQTDEAETETATTSTTDEEGSAGSGEDTQAPEDAEEVGEGDEALDKGDSAIANQLAALKK